MGEATSYLNEIDLIKGVIAARLLDIEDGNNVLMVEVSQQLHLTEGSETEHGVIEGCYLLDGNLLARWFVDGGASYQGVLVSSLSFSVSKAPFGI